MTVYVITSGDYSSYHIDAVCLDKDQAEKVCATLNDQGECWYSEYVIEEYDTDSVKVETNEEVKKKYKMLYDFYYKEEIFFGDSITFQNVNKIDFIGEKEISIEFTCDKDMPEEKVKKIMYDRITKFLAENTEMRMVRKGE